MAAPIKIQRENLFLAKGEDPKYFFWYLLDALGIENIDKLTAELILKHRIAADTFNNDAWGTLAGLRRARLK
jgi:hypothetical protein